MIRAPYIQFVVALAITAATGLAAPIGYAINFSGQFGTIDLGTGAFAPVGPGLVNTPDGMGGKPGGPF